jgi:hypothetical protein
MKKLLLFLTALFLMSFTNIYLNPTCEIQEDFVMVKYHIDNTYHVQINVFNLKDGLIAFYEDENTQTSGNHTIKILRTKFIPGTSYYYVLKATDQNNAVETYVDRIFIP